MMRSVFLAAVVVLTMAASSQQAAAQALLKAQGGVFPFPTLMSMIYDVIKAKGFDKANGVDLETVTYGQISGYFAGLAKGEIAMGPAGVENVQKMRDQGVPVAIVLTLTRLSAMSVIVSDPAIKSVTDLKGKSLAATMGSAEYQVLSTYALKNGVKFGTDVTVVQAASPMLGAQQFKAKRVDAVMAWEPAATMILADNPSYRIAFTGEDAWRSLGKGAGWQLSSPCVKTTSPPIPALSTACSRCSATALRSFMPMSMKPTSWCRSCHPGPSRTRSPRAA